MNQQTKKEHQYQNRFIISGVFAYLYNITKKNKNTNKKAENIKNLFLLRSRLEKRTLFSYNKTNSLNMVREYN